MATITDRIVVGETVVPRAYVHLGLTGKCPSRCVKCRVWRSPPEPGSGLRSADWVRIVGDLGEVLVESQITLSGGEPLLLEGIYDVIRAASALPDVFAVVNTSAYFIDDWIADRLAESGARIFGIGMDGLREANDRMKGVPGAYDGALAAVGRIRERIPDAVIGLVYLLAGPTMAGAAEFAKAHAADPRIREIRYQPVFQPLGLPFRTDWFRGHPLWPNPADAERTLDELVALKKEGLPIQNSLARLGEIRAYFRDPQAKRTEPCPAGTGRWVIDDRGRVFFCPYHEVVGDARETPIAEILASDRARAARGKIAGCDIRFCHLATNGGG